MNAPCALGVYGRDINIGVATNKPTFETLEAQCFISTLIVPGRCSSPRHPSSPIGISFACACPRFDRIHVELNP